MCHRNDTNSLVYSKSCFQRTKFMDMGVWWSGFATPPHPRFFPKCVTPTEKHLNTKGNLKTQKIFALCGILSPIIFILMTILGGTLRTGNSHISDTVSELFPPDAPNKKWLDLLHISTAVLGIMFGIGVLQFVRSIDDIELFGVIV